MAPHHLKLHYVRVHKTKKFEQLVAVFLFVSQVFPTRL